MRYNRVKGIFAVLFLLAMLVGTVFILNRANNKRFIRNSGSIFGTTYHITYQSSDSLHAEIKQVLNEVDATFSMFNKQSLTARVNRGELVALTQTFVDVFSLTQKISKETDGAFDITVAPLVNAWGFGTSDTIQPSQGQINSIMKYIGYTKVSLKGNKLIKSNPHVQLDFSAVAKGYACDAVAQMLRKHAVSNYMVEIGGEVVCRGNNPDNKAWTIGIQQPVEDVLNNTSELQAILQVRDRAVATSGNYRNYYYKDGKRYAHTIDPRQGTPVQHSLLSATVVADNCTMADAYATAFMVFGAEKAKQWLSGHEDVQAFLIYTDKKGKFATWCSPSLKPFVR